ncbi:hypothetical protein GF336_07805 [Candidatus Woesearchaeota archaeon]|nr:hypothetical protein [Candidatus Woesearchaeota archaeon]
MKCDAEDCNNKGLDLEHISNIKLCRKHKKIMEDSAFMELLEGDEDDN